MRTNESRKTSERFDSNSKYRLKTELSNSEIKINKFTVVGKSYRTIKIDGKTITTIFITVNKQKGFDKWLNHALTTSLGLNYDNKLWLMPYDDETRELEKQTDVHDSWKPNNIDGVAVDIFYGKDKIIIAIIMPKSMVDSFMSNFWKTATFKSRSL
jgi:hypothetical protein